MKKSLWFKELKVKGQIATGLIATGLIATGVKTKRRMMKKQMRKTNLRRMSWEKFVSLVYERCAEYLVIWITMYGPGMKQGTLKLDVQLFPPHTKGLNEKYDSNNLSCECIRDDDRDDLVVIEKFSDANGRMTSRHPLRSRNFRRKYRSLAQIGCWVSSESRKNRRIRMFIFGGF
mmetsp:Transcript_33773/g.45651  ORF Transcript_33773/g.45651 Transcript_33773/m.45651 type:complete len:175 (-) Transcript_33773:792-1316(-)